MNSQDTEPQTPSVRLVAISGPLNGTDSHPDGDWNEISIGRDEDNDICVQSRSVSRRHCVIQRKDAQLVIRDMDSRNGTFVNDIPVKERALRKGDQIGVGDSVFILVVDEEKPAAAELAHSDDTGMVSVDVVGLSPDESIYITKNALAATMPRSNRVLNNLNTLLEISNLVSAVQSIEELQEKLLTSLADVVPAEHAAILFVGMDGPEVESPHGWSRSEGMGVRVKPSRTIVKQVVETRTALLAQGFLSGPLSGVESIASSKVRSILCVPIQVVGKMLGVVYMATSDADSPFDKDHLQFLTAVASIAAVSIHNVRQMEFLKGENQRLSKEIELNHSMVGESSAMRHVYQIVAKVAPASSTVLINGESGTGKELVARAIHSNSPRSDKPFIAINCAAIPETLLESELFGSEKGAYTGAPQRKGKLEVAEGGTILLDEIGELPLPLQAKLLRVLQERVFERLGGTRSIPVNVRWLAATNRDLKQAIQARTFREDLYFRLQVITIKMPPLRERREDIPLLCGYFAHKYSKLCGRPVKGISPEAKARLVHYEWPGNVRELENTIERAVVMGSGDYVLPEDLNENLFESEAPPGVDTGMYHQAVKEAKQRIVRGALERHSGNVSDAARQLGIHPNNLHRLIRNLGIK